jgi:hypothetical protein
MSLATTKRGNGAMAPYQPEHSTSLASSSVMTLSEVWQMAEYVSASRLFGTATPEQAFTLMMICQSEGLHPIQAMRRFDIIDGRPALKAAAIQAEFQRLGGRIEIGVCNAAEANATFSHPVYQPNPVAMKTTFEHYKKIGLTGKKNWTNDPEAMLWWRLVAKGVRRIYPGIVVGIYSADEVQDMIDADAPPARHVSSELEARAVIAAADPAVPGWNPAEVDARPYHEIVTAAVNAVNAEYPPAGGTTPGLDARKVHGLLAARAVNTDHADGPAPTKVGAAVTFMAKVYDAHRQWVREELARLCEDHVRELIEATDALAESRRAPEDASQDAPDEDSALDVLYPDGQLGMSE